MNFNRPVPFLLDFHCKRAYIIWWVINLSLRPGSSVFLFDSCHEVEGWSLMTTQCVFSLNNKFYSSLQDINASSSLLSCGPQKTQTTWPLWDYYTSLWGFSGPYAGFWNEMWNRAAGCGKITVEGIDFCLGSQGIMYIFFHQSLTFRTCKWDFRTC